MFFSIAKDQAVAIRQRLLVTLGEEPDRAVRNKISYAVAEVARQYIENSQLPMTRLTVTTIVDTVPLSCR
jgi:hypothetical protein